jgi:hypothetical protein
VEALATVDDLAAYLRQEGGAAALDTAAAELALASGSGVVRTFCRWQISAVTETLIADGDGSGVLSLPTLYLRDVTEVRTGQTTADPAGYSWSAGGQLFVNSGGGWPIGFRNVEADVLHGYDSSETPDAVRLAVLAHAARQYANPLGLTSRSVGGVSEAWALTELQVAQLSPYRLP